MSTCWVPMHRTSLRPLGVPVLSQIEAEREAVPIAGGAGL